MKIITLFFVLRSFPLHAQEELFPWQEVDRILNQHHQGCGEITEVLTTPECDEVERYRKSHPLNWEEVSSRHQILSRLINQCQESRFRQCYPRLKKEISEEDLNQLMKTLMQSTRCHMNLPDHACLNRATALNYYLAEAGYEVQMLNLAQAPTIISMGMDREGKPTGRFDRYGSHFVPVIQMRQNGKLIPMVLDPQFFLHPVPLEDYLIRLTGQRCQEVERTRAISLDDQSSWACLYKLEQQNYFMEMEDRHDELDRFPSRLEGRAQTSSDPSHVGEQEESLSTIPQALRCGWWSLPTMLKDIDRSNKAPKFRSVAIPANFRGRDEAWISEELILGSYEERYEAYLYLEKEVKARLARLEADPADFFGDYGPYNQPETDAETRARLYEEARTLMLKELVSYERLIREYGPLMRAVRENLKKTPHPR